MLPWSSRRREANLPVFVQIPPARGVQLVSKSLLLVLGRLGGQGEDVHALAIETDLEVLRFVERGDVVLGAVDLAHQRHADDVLAIHGKVIPDEGAATCAQRQIVQTLVLLRKILRHTECVDLRKQHGGADRHAADSGRRDKIAFHEGG